MSRSLVMAHELAHASYYPRIEFDDGMLPLSIIFDEQSNEFKTQFNVGLNLYTINSYDGGGLR